VELRVLQHVDAAELRLRRVLLLLVEQELDQLRKDDVHLLGRRVDQVVRGRIDRQLAQHRQDLVALQQRVAVLRHGPRLDLALAAAV